MITIPSVLWRLALLCLLVASSGCLAAFGLGAGAGAAGTLATHDRAASSLVDAPLEVTVERTKQAFQEFQIEMTGEEAQEFNNDIEITGTTGSLDIIVDLERRGPNSTFVEISARENAVSWNKDYATRLMERIVASQ